MNKLLRSITSINATAPNENNFKATPNQITTNITVDIDTWRFFENLDEDSRQMMARVLKDYVEQQG
jgi:hypothetical protein